MESVNSIELSNATIFPDERILKNVLGNSFSVYVDLLKLYDEYGMKYEWKYYKDGKAWLCKVQEKKRSIVWMSAWKGYMQATIYFPEKYVAEAMGIEMDGEIKERIKRTKIVGRSKPFIFEIRDKEVLKDIENVIRYKIANK